MTWNYRVMRHDEVAIRFYCIHEVYYGRDGRAEGWTTTASGGGMGDDPDELLLDMVHVMQAITKPILSYADGKEVEPARFDLDHLVAQLQREVELSARPYKLAGDWTERPEEPA